MGHGIVKMVGGGEVWYIDQSDFEDTYTREGSGVKRVALDDWRVMGIGEAADEIIAADDSLVVADPSLPQPWVDEVVERTGKYPYGFVWAYGKGMSGRQLAVTDEAKIHDVEIRRLGITYFG